MPDKFHYQKLGIEEQDVDNNEKMARQQRFFKKRKNPVAKELLSSASKTKHQVMEMKTRKRDKHLRNNMLKELLDNAEDLDYPLSQ